MDLLRKILAKVKSVRRKGTGSEFYRVVGDCQVPKLGFLYETFLGRRSDGVYVEVGAYDGISWSNTSCLAELGWRGILAEPVPEFAELCRKRYEDKLEVTVVQTAIGDSNETVELTVGSALTTANTDLLKEYKGLSWTQRAMRSSKKVQVEQMKLDELLEGNDISAGFDVLSVDVEGYEAAVFAGFDLARWKPKIMIVELVDIHESLKVTRAKDTELLRAILNAGYDVVYKDFINTVFVRRDIRDAVNAEV